MISPLALVSVWAALKLKLIAWHHLAVWIALFEVRCWRDSLEPEQRNLFEFSAKRVAQALGKRNAGPRLKKALVELEQLRLASLTPKEISFTPCLDDLPHELRAETDRMLKSLGTRNVTRPMRMPRRLMRLIMKSRVKLLRAAVIFGMLLRIMPVKRYGRYKGCLTTALLVDLSGFNKSRIMHERASLVREGYFERLETPHRVRQQYGDWYALPRDLPVFSDPQSPKKKQPSVAFPQANRQPPIEEPVPSFGIETNQYLAKSPGASRSTFTPEATEVSTWSCMSKEDLQEPPRRKELYGDACQRGVIGESLADRLMFYSAMARARRLGSINPCGMFRRIVETADYHRHITGCDEDQGRSWMAEDQPMDPDTVTARNLVHCIVEAPNDGFDLAPVNNGEAEAPIIAEHAFDTHAEDSVEGLALVMSQDEVDSALTDSQVYRILAQGLMRNGDDPAGQEAYEIVRQSDKRNVLKGWTRERWEAAKAEESGQRFGPKIHLRCRGGPGNL